MKQVLATSLPAEWRALQEHVSQLPPIERGRIEPVMAEAMEHTLFRERVIGLAREAIEQFRCERALLEFDLEVTRRERADLRKRIEFGED